MGQKVCKVALCAFPHQCQEHCQEFFACDDEDEISYEDGSQTTYSGNTFPAAPGAGPTSARYEDPKTKKEKEKEELDEFTNKAKKGIRVTVYIDRNKYICAYRLSSDMTYITFVFSRVTAPDRMDVIISLRTLHSLITSEEKEDMFWKIPPMVERKTLLMVIDKDIQLCVEFESQAACHTFKKCIKTLQEKQRSGVGKRAMIIK